MNTDYLYFTYNLLEQIDGISCSTTCWDCPVTRKVYIQQRLMLCYHLRFRGRKASARIIIEICDMMGRSLPTIYMLMETEDRFV